MTAIRPAGPGIAIGLNALGIANGSKTEILATVARRADEAGFGTLWCGERPTVSLPWILPGDRAVQGMARVQPAQDADQRQVVRKPVVGHVQRERIRRREQLLMWIGAQPERRFARMGW